MKFTAIYRRHHELFEKNSLKTSKIEKEILADDIHEAAKQAKKNEFKGFYLLGVKPCL
jgi:hypothetical protein